MSVSAVDTWQSHAVHETKAQIYMGPGLRRAAADSQRYFSPSDPEAGASLAISGGRGGARLTHSHERQYSYVLQSLSLWREINTDMFKLWCLAEADLLSESNTYRLVNTGAGHLRCPFCRALQACVFGSVAMQVCLICVRTAQQAGVWSGCRSGHEPGATGAPRQQSYPQHPVAMSAADRLLGRLVGEPLAPLLAASCAA